MCCCSDGVAQRTAKLLGLYTSDDDNVYSRKVIATVAVLVICLLHMAWSVGLMLGLPYIPDEYKDSKDLSDSGFISFVSAVYFAFVLPYSVHSMATESFRSILFAAFDNAELVSYMDWPMNISLGSLGFMSVIGAAAATGLYPFGVPANTAYIVASVATSIGLMTYIFVPVGLCVGIYYTTSALLFARTEWIENELADSIRTGYLDAAAALRIIRSYGSISVLIETVGAACSPVMVGMTVFLFLNVMINFLSAVSFITETGEWDLNVNYAVFSTLFCLGAVSFVLYFPARMSAAVVHSSTRLRFICSAAVHLKDNNYIQPVSFSASSAAALSRRASFSAEFSSKSSSSSSSSDSYDDSSGGEPRGSTVTRNEGDGSENALGGLRMRQASAARESAPLNPIPTKANGGSKSVFRLDEVATHLQRGRDTEAELQLVSFISTHLHARPALMHVGGVEVTYATIGKLLTSSISFIFFSLRFAASLG